MRSRRQEAPLALGRYRISREIASGGMATVHVGRLVGEGFTRAVAIKRMHPHLAKDPEFVAMFMDEARLSAHVHHPNVVSTLDVVSQDGELFVVMDYVHGDSLAALLRVAREARLNVPLPVVTRIAYEVLSGLHAAHEAVGENGEPLGIVHRDVSPQNVLVGIDGVTRIIDFGVAKAASRLQTTREGQIKGKLAYMAPEQLLQLHVDRRSDVYAASVVLWELLTNQRLFVGDSDGATMQRVLAGDVRAPSSVEATVPAALDEVVLRGLARTSDARFRTARDMAEALRASSQQAATGEVAAFVERLVGEKLQTRAHAIGTERVDTMSDVAGGDPVRVAEGESEQSATQLAPLTTEARRAPRYRIVAWAASVALAGVLAGWTFTVVHARAERDPATIARSEATEVLATPAVPTASTASGASTTPGESSAAPSSPPGARPEAPVKAKPMARSRTALPSRDVSCNPPYTVDALGVRTYKKACVTRP